MREPFFSIIVVCLNPGDKLKSTLDSIAGQTFHDFQVIVKDGGSVDGSLDDAEALEEAWREEERSLRIIRRKDAGIYDAMNQAALEAAGRFLYFLNCGDRFYSAGVLQEMWEFMKGREAGKGIYYGDIFERLTGQRVVSNPHMDAFGCYRNVPCHQACFYSREIFDWHCFETRYLVRADYEQFLWCFLACKDGLAFAYHKIIIADYEGGGFSESRENRTVSAREHKEITGKYLSKGQLFRFRLIMLLTLAPLRTKIAQNEKTAKLYNRLKEILYAGKRQ